MAALVRRARSRRFVGRGRRVTALRAGLPYPEPAETTALRVGIAYTDYGAARGAATLHAVTGEFLCGV